MELGREVRNWKVGNKIFKIRKIFNQCQYADISSNLSLSTMRTDYSELIAEYFRNVERLETDPEYREYIAVYLV